MERLMRLNAGAKIILSGVAVWLLMVSALVGLMWANELVGKPPTPPATVTLTIDGVGCNFVARAWSGTWEATREERLILLREAMGERLSEMWERDVRVSATAGEQALEACDPYIIPPLVEND